MSEQWLLLKRGLFYRPNNCGYTGIRDEAGRYSREDADEHAAAGGIVMREADAPEFMPAAFTDLVINHLTDQRDTMVKTLEALRDDPAVPPWIQTLAKGTLSRVGGSQGG